MTSSERNIADRLASVTIPWDSTRDKVFIKQLPNWYERNMTEAGRSYMLRLLQKYSTQIPDHSELHSACVMEQLSKLAP